MSAPTMLADVVDDTLCGCGRRYSSHYADQGRMRGPDCPDFHTECDPTCKHPRFAARPATATTVRLAERVGGYARERQYVHPNPEVPAYLREEPLPSDSGDEADEPALPPAPETPAPVAEPVDLAVAAEATAARILQTSAAASALPAADPVAVDAPPAAEEVAAASSVSTAAAADLRTRLAELAEELLARRKRAGMSQGALARASALPPSVVSAVENGTRRLTPDTLYALAAALGCDVELQLVDRSAAVAGEVPAVDVEAVRSLAIDMYQAWLCPKCHARRHDRVRCCGRTLQPVWVAAIPREVTGRG